MARAHRVRGSGYRPRRRFLGSIRGGAEGDRGACGHGGRQRGECCPKHSSHWVYRSVSEGATELWDAASAARKSSIVTWSGSERGLGMVGLMAESSSRHPPGDTPLGLDDAHTRHTGAIRPRQGASVGRASYLALGSG